MRTILAALLLTSLGCASLDGITVVASRSTWGASVTANATTGDTSLAVGYDKTTALMLGGETTSVYLAMGVRSTTEVSQLTTTIDEVIATGSAADAAATAHGTPPTATDSEIDWEVVVDETRRRLGGAP